jgi:integrase
MEEGRGLTEAALTIVDRLKYVHEDIDRHGNVRVYFWRGAGHRKIRIREAPGTPAFRKRYDELLEEPTEKVHAAPIAYRATEGSWRWLCESYLAQSTEFKKIQERGRKKRRAILESTWAEPFVPGEPETFATLPVGEMTPRLVKVLRDRKANVEQAANERLKAIRRVFAWAISDEKASSNPARDVPCYAESPEGFHTWSIEEIGQYDAYHALGTKARLAKDLLLFSGVRRSDVVLLGKQMIRRGWLRFTETKGRDRTLKQREIPVLPALQASIDAFPSDNLTFLVTEFGKPFTANGFGNWFRDRCDDAKLPQCSAHGLRKAGATIAAENGATEHQLMAIYGWESPKQAARYTRKARRKMLTGSGMGLINFPTEISPPDSEEEKDEKSN